MNLNLSLTLATLGLTSFLIIGCEKSNDLSTTDPADSDAQKIVLEPEFHMSFPPGMSEKKMDSLWHQGFSKHSGNNNYVPDVSGPVNGFRYKIITRTGTYKYDATDSRVMARLWYEVDGVSKWAEVKLDNPGNDREKGQTDVYTTIVPVPIGSTLKFKSFRLKMEGTDGWGIQYFVAEATPELQDPGYPCISCSGSVTPGGSTSSTCNHTGSTRVEQYEREFIDKDNPNHPGSVRSYNNYGTLKVKGNF